MIVPPWFKRKEALRLSEASLARLRRIEREKLLAEESDKRHARRKVRLDLNIKP